MKLFALIIGFFLLSGSQVYAAGTASTSDQASACNVAILNAEKAIAKNTDLIGTLAELVVEKCTVNLTEKAIGNYREIVVPKCDSTYGDAAINSNQNSVCKMYGFLFSMWSVVD